MKKTDIEQIEKQLVMMVNTSGIEYATYGYTNEQGWMVKLDAVRGFLNYLDSLKKEAE